jgi:hypothetical protein
LMAFEHLAQTIVPKLTMRERPLRSLLNKSQIASFYS